MDVGGSLLYRAQGGPKGTQFGDTVTEIDSLRDPSINASAAAVYGSMSDADIAESAKNLLNISDEDIDNIVDESFDGVDDANRLDVDNLKATLKARRQDILNRFGLSESGEPTPEEPTDSETTPDATPEVTDIVVEAPEPAVAEPTESAEVPAVPEGANAPEASYDPSQSATMSRNFNDVMTNFAVINDSQDGDNLRVEYGYVDEDGDKQMLIVGVRKTNGIWKSSQDSDAKEVIFDPDNGVYTLTDDELIAKLDALGSDKQASSKVLRYGSRAGLDDTEITPQLLEYGYGSSTPSSYIPRSFYGENEDIKLTYDPDGNFYGYDSNGNQVAYTPQELTTRAQNGEKFKTGTPRSALPVGSQATDQWVDNPRQGDMMHQGRGYYSDPTAVMRESFLANEDGEWVSSYTGDVIPKNILKTMGSLRVGDAKRALAVSKSENYDDYYSYELNTRGGVKTASRASKDVIEGIRIDNLFTDGTDTYRAVQGGPRSLAFTNVATGDTLDRTAMRKLWDIRGDNFKFLTGLEGVDVGDVVTEPAAVDNPTASTVFKRVSSMNLPYAKGAFTTQAYYMFDGSNWRAVGGSSIDLRSLKGYISNGEITLASPSDAVTTPDTTSAELADERGIASFKSQLEGVDSPELTSAFSDDALSRMRAGSLSNLSTLLSDNVGTDGKISPAILGQAILQYHPDSTGNFSPDTMMQVLSQIDDPNFAVRGRTYGELLGEFDTAIAKTEARLSNLESHPVKELGNKSNVVMELVNTLFPELSDKPDVVATKQEMIDYDSEYDIVYRGLTPVRYTAPDGTTKTATARELHELFRTADGLWWGHGVYGQGLYSAKDVSTPLAHYANRDTDGVGVLKAKKDINILKSADEQDESFLELISYYRQVLTAYLVSRGFIPGSAAFNSAFSKYQDSLFSDASGRAAFFGYDAVHLTNMDYYIFLNRAAIVAYDGTYKDWLAE
jgi:hypothetical protein